MKHRTARRYGWHCGGPCMSWSTRRRTCSRTTLACGWPTQTTAGGPAVTWTRAAPACSGPESWQGHGSSRTWWPSRRIRASDSTSSSEQALTPSPSAWPDVAARLRVFEIDRPGPQAWKRKRLIELGYGVPDWLRLVPVDFEAGEEWWDRLAAAGFDAAAPAVVASAGVSMYLTKDANAATLRQISSLGPGSTVVMSFMPPIELVDEEDRPVRQFSENGARASGTPFITFYAPDDAVALAREAGFADARHVSAAMLNQWYYAGQDGRPSDIERRGAAGGDQLSRASEDSGHRQPVYCVGSLRPDGHIHRGLHAPRPSIAKLGHRLHRGVRDAGQRAHGGEPGDERGWQRHSHRRG